MEFKRISIQPEGQDAINVLFNPTQYTVEKTNQIAEVGIPGLEAPILQYVHGNTRTLAMELYFDTYEQRSDVRQHTDKIYKLLGIDSDTHVPPICNLSWGTFNFRGVLEKVSGQFTLFLSDGTPVRAKLNVSFKEYIDVLVLVREHPTHSADHRKTRVVSAGDRLDTIADEEYGDCRKWRYIADANRLEHPDRLIPGATLIIPAIA